MAADDWTKFPPVPQPATAFRDRRAFLIGLLGPPGSGKTRTMLRLMRGAQRVFSGPIVLIDTEAGRSLDYAPKKGEKPNPDDPVEPTYEFERLDLGPPFRSDRFLAAVREALKLKPAAIGIDNLSDEHIGEGGYLEYHDAEVPRLGGNEYTAWGRPKMLRTRMLSGFSHIVAPPMLFFSFLSEEKSEQVKVKDERSGREKNVVRSRGWIPIAPLLALKTLNLTVVLPWDSKGTPVWQSRDLPAEDFMRKWPDHLLALMKPGQVTEAHGEALARWVKGEPALAIQTPASAPPAPDPGPAPGPAPDPKAQALAAALATLQRLATKDERGHAMALHFAGATGWSGVKALDLEAIEAGTASLSRELDGLEAMRQAPVVPEMWLPSASDQEDMIYPPVERVPGEDDEEGGAP